jgi:hypothetical protein
VSSHPHRNKLLSDVPDEVWAVARERGKVIRHLVQEPPAYGSVLHGCTRLSQMKSNQNSMLVCE